MLVVRILTEEPPKFADLEDAVVLSEATEAAVTRAVAKRADARWASVTEFADQLAEALSNEDEDAIVAVQRTMAVKLYL